MFEQKQSGMTELDVIRTLNTITQYNDWEIVKYQPNEA